MSTFWYEVRDDIIQEAAKSKMNFKEPICDKGKLVSCKIDASDKESPYKSVFQDNHSFFGKADKGIHEKVRGRIFEAPMLWDPAEFDSERFKGLPRLVISQDEYEKCKKLKDVSIFLDAEPTAAYPEPDHIETYGKENDPTAAFRRYIFTKNNNEDNRANRNSDLPLQFRPYKYTFKYKGETVYESPQFYSFLDPFPVLPEPNTKELELLHFGVEAYYRYEPLATKKFESRVFEETPPQDKGYSPEALYESMHFRRNAALNDVYEDRCRFYENAAIALCYDAPNTDEGQERFAKAMLTKMAKEGLSKKQMTEVMLREEKEGILNKGLDLLERDKVFMKELNAIRKGAKKTSPSISR